MSPCLVSLTATVPPCCWKYYFPYITSKRDVLKVDFSPEKTPLQYLPRNAYLQQTAKDMLSLLRDPLPSPLHQPLTFGPPILNALAQVAGILGHAVKPPAPLPPPPWLIVESPFKLLRVPFSTPPFQLPVMPSLTLPMSSFPPFCPNHAIRPLHGP